MVVHNSLYLVSGESVVIPSFFFSQILYLCLFSLFSFLSVCQFSGFFILALLALSIQSLFFDLTNFYFYLTLI